MNKICICLNCGKEFEKKPSTTGKYCSITCLHEKLMKDKYQEYLLDQNKYAGLSNMKWIKPHILKEQECRCAICNRLNVWEDKELVFILDHIDGHANNNYRNNLRLVCPNCDSLLDTYKSKNKNSDRIYYHTNHR